MDPNTSFVESRYNFAFPQRGDDVLMYNSLTNSVVRISRTQYSAFAGLCRLGEPLAIDRPLLGGLAQQGFLVPSEFDELEAIRSVKCSQRKSTDSLALTIQPTLSCNFRCDYCFQDHPKAFMSREVEEALGRFVDGHTPALSILGVTWFGGEPLLALASIVRLSAIFRVLAERHGFSLAPARLVTNGWGLNESCCEQLKTCNIASIQVTIDGIGPAHDARRPLADGRPTFERIVDNLKTTRRVLPDAKLTVRANIDAGNPTALEETRAWFAAQGLSDIVVTAGQVREYTDRCSVEAGVLADHQLFRITRKSDSDAVGESAGRQIGFPSPKPLACCAVKENAYVVSPTGALFKCWIEGDVDESRAVGHLLSEGQPETRSQTLFRKLYDDWDQMADPECVECSMLPICAGGCMWSGMQAAGDMTRGAKVCTPYKFGSSLEHAVRTRLERSRTQQLSGKTS